MDDVRSLAESIAATCRRRGAVVVAAESITAGRIGSALAAAPGASDWFGASILAYRTAQKRGLLGVTAERIISADCARQMAEGMLQLTDADLVVTTTGVGGPDDEEGRPPGTVVICAGTRDELRVVERQFDGDPPAVVEQATRAALRQLADAAVDGEEKS